ncbi:MAG: hypothetical protein LBO81_01940, partial [Clostridiales Family XIII bacterium]|nr:hypothetical protein [Clostridiales Family XIII bacterium]
TYGAYDNDNKFTGLNFAKVKPSMPGDSFIKRARVANTGVNPFYTAVYGKLVFKDKDKKELDWEKITGLIDETYTRVVQYNNNGQVTGPFSDNLVAKINALNSSDPAYDADFQALKNYAFLELVLADGTNEGWYGTPIIAKADSDGHTEFFGTWYYAKEDSGDLKLTEVGKDSATDPIFDTVRMPIELGDKAQNVSIELKLFALAVQSDNIESTDITGGPDTWADFFGNAGK